eukprot:1049733-Rhodomonas_salina.1
MSSTGAGYAAMLCYMRSTAIACTTVLYAVQTSLVPLGNTWLSHLERGAPTIRKHVAQALQNLSLSSTVRLAFIGSGITLLASYTLDPRP